MDTSPQELAGLASRLSALANELQENQDPAFVKAKKQELIVEAKKTIWQLQDPMSSLLDHTTNAYTNATMSALLEIGVFDAVPLEGTANVKEIAKACGAEEDLIIRLMRQMTAANIFEETTLHEWRHNARSIGLSTKTSMSGRYFLQICMDEMYPAMHYLNVYLRKYGKKDIHTYTETPHSWHFGMLGTPFFEVLCSSQERLDSFNRGLSLFEAVNPTLGIYPFDEILKAGNSPDRPFVVDVGGGFGRAMLELRGGCPDLKGEIILQERQVVLDQIKDGDLPGVTKMAHDFFTPQPVKNAQVYYIRRVLHDWQKEEATKILAMIKPAMGPDSRIIISEMALPEPATTEHANAIWLDLMMLTIGGKERTARDWQDLAEAAGLKLVKIWQRPEFGPLAFVEIMLPEAS